MLFYQNYDFIDSTLFDELYKIIPFIPLSTVHLIICYKSDLESVFMWALLSAEQEAITSSIVNSTVTGFPRLNGQLDWI